MGTDTTPPDIEPSDLDDENARRRQPSERVRKAVVNDNTNGAPRLQHTPDPSPDGIVLLSLVPS
ncbi:hypothetical protein Rumeso_04902 [Rubellimicrobium mesophilum DSM 19309]|uniref:Uncharacterized protein n=1 Tax=Rubellimicrobium mesophilum DSM 19309 TaxID=442562 RepID=A0A017HAV9_9RHOB|nr:hypothetical protein [Rubellimicrobium mesophilum]EYD71501.1 hypothetical protein Rumeso_04902 [Rubellimicrobium mesophilum DSM 19309]